MADKISLILARKLGGKKGFFAAKAGLLEAKNHVREGVLNALLYGKAGGGGGTDTTVTGSLPLTLASALAKPLVSLTREGKVEQRTLPKGYTELDKIIMTPTSDSDFSQVLDTGLKCTEKTDIRCGFKATDNANRFVYGASTSNPRLTLYRNGTSGNQRFGTAVVSKSVSYGEAHDIVHNATALTIDGVSSAYSAQSAFTTADNITIGNCNGNTGTPPFIGEWYYYQHIEDGVLLRDYVPATDGTHYGLYDKVNGTFLWAEGITGGTTASPTPDRPIDLWCNNGKLKARHQSGLPLGYTLLDYARSNGTQYIDLGYKGNGNTKVEVKFKYYQASSATGSGRVFGSRNNSQSFAFAIGTSSGTIASTETNKAFWCYDSQTFYVADESFGLDVWKTIVFSAKEHTIDGVSVGDDYNIVEFETPQNLKLFGFDNNNTMGVGYVDIAHCKLWDNGTLVRDLVPAKNASNVVSMYDLVSGTFLPNAGTGDFVAGSDVSDPVEIYVDGTPEVLKVTGKNLYNPAATAKGKTLNDSGELVVLGDSYLSRYTDLIPVKPSTTYAFKLTRTASAIFTRVCTYDVLGQFIALKYKSTDVTDTTLTATFTTEANAAYVRMSFKFNSTEVQLEEGNTQTKYEPYHEQTASVPDLFAVGDYKDTDEIISGLKTGKVRARTLTGDENWSLSTGTNLVQFYTGDFSSEVNSSQSIVSTVAPYGCTAQNRTQYDFGCYSGSSGNLCFQMQGDETLTSTPIFKNRLRSDLAAGRPWIVIYKLATETTEQTTPQPLTTSKGTNVVDSENNVPPVSATIVYKKR